MDLTAEAIAKIQELERHADPIHMAPDYNVTGRFFLRHADGSVSEHAAVRRPDSARLHSTESLARLITAETELDARAKVYYGADEIVAVIEDDGEIEWRHGIKLPRHPAFARLERLTRTETFTQRTLIRLLRAEFNGHVDDRIIERFRTLNLKTDGTGQNVVAQGRAAVDRRIQQRISDDGGKDIPTEITVSVPVYDLDEARDDVMPVGLLVDVLPDEDGRAVFELTTVINTLASARREALDRLVRNLVAELPAGVPVYYGSV